MNRLIASDCHCAACREEKVTYLWLRDDPRARRSRESCLSPASPPPKNTAPAAHDLLQCG